MTFEIAALLALLLAMVALFLTEALPFELTAFAGLAVLVFTGWVPADRAFDGFASPAVITMLGTFFVGAALAHTGIADALALRLERAVGSREATLAFSVALAGGCFAAFMNKLAAMAMLMPATSSLARRTNVSPSKLFLPLAFGTTLGSTVTLLGTPPNMIASDMLRAHGDAPFGLFEFAPFGVPLLLLGAAVLGMLTHRVLPARVAPTPVSRRSDLLQVYQLESSLFSIRVPAGSGLEGRTLRDTRLGHTLDVQVVAILRDGRRRLAPEGETVLRAEDVLLVQGKAEDVRELLRVRGAILEEARPEELEAASRAIAGVVMQVRDASDLVGRTLRQSQFRSRFGLVVIALRRAGTLVGGDLGEIALSPSDELLAIGPRGSLDEAALHRQFVVGAMDARVFGELQGRIYVLGVPETSGLAGQTIAESRIGELVGLTVSAIVRDGRTLLGLDPTERLRPGDRLLVTGEAERIRDLASFGGVELLQEVAAGALESEGVGIVEAAIAPRSQVAGRTLAEIDFRERYGLSVLGVWRAGTLLHEHLAELRLAFGDALLLHGPWARIRQLARGRDVVMLSPTAPEEHRTKKAPWVLAALVLMIGLVVAGWQPPHVAAFAAGTFVVLVGAITMEEAYRAVEWRVLFLVAALLPIGMALDRTGGGALLAGAACATLGAMGPHAAVVTLAALGSALSQLLDGSPAVVMLAPIAFAVSAGLGMSARPLLMAVALGTSAAYLAPVSTKVNLLVMGAGGYRASDYFRAGLPLTILHLGLIAVLVPLMFRF
ncbi:MAG: SLC13 family permease [bacterium]